MVEEDDGRMYGVPLPLPPGKHSVPADSAFAPCLPREEGGHAHYYLCTANFPEDACPVGGPNFIVFPPHYMT